MGTYAIPLRVLSRTKDERIYLIINFTSKSCSKQSSLLLLKVMGYISLNRFERRLGDSAPDLSIGLTRSPTAERLKVRDSRVTYSRINRERRQTATVWQLILSLATKPSQRPALTEKLKSTSASCGLDIMARKDQRAVYI